MADRDSSSPPLNRKPPSTERQIIVQCPQCQTKFSIDAAVIDTPETPRFHCSRCDNVFAAPELNQPALPFKDMPPVGRPQAAEQRFSLGGPVPRDERRPSRSLEIPKGIDRGFDLTPPHESFDGPRTPSEQESFSFLPQTVPADETPQRSFGFSVSDIPETDDDFAFTAEEARFAAEEPQLGLPVPAAEISAPITRSGWSGVMAMAAPLICFLGLLAGASLYLRWNPAAAETVALPGLPQAVKAAPAGLYIINTKFKDITLDNGETAHIISGTLVNETSQTIKDILLQGVLFSESGQALESARIDAGSALAKSRIRSLSAEMIRDLQAKAPARRFELAAGQEQEFAIAMQSGEPQAAFYSARVYSVRE